MAKEQKFTDPISDLNSSNIDVVRVIGGQVLMHEPSLECVFNYLEWVKFFWILPQRRELSIWTTLWPLTFPILMLLALLVLIWWTIAKADADFHYRDLIFTSISMVRVILSSALPTVPESRKLRTFLLFTVLMFIPINVNLQTVWTTTCTHPIREPKITNLKELVKSDIPMVFPVNHVEEFSLTLNKENVKMLKEKWRDPTDRPRDGDPFGRTGIASFEIEHVLYYIKNIEDVEMFEQVREKVILQY